MSRYEVNVKYIIESDELDEDDLTTHFDNQGDPNVILEAPLTSESADEGDMGEFRIVESDSTVTVLEF